MRRLVKELKEAEQLISRHGMPADAERRISERLFRNRPADRNDKEIEELGEGLER